MSQRGAATTLHAIAHTLRSTLASVVPSNLSTEAFLGVGESRKTTTAEPERSAPHDALLQFRPLIIVGLMLLIAATLTLAIPELLGVQKFLIGTRQAVRHVVNNAGALLLVLAGAEAVVILLIVIRDRRSQRLEALLQEREDRLVVAAEAADLGLWQWDARTDRFWATAHCQEMFGISPGTEYSMAMVMAAVHPDELPTVSRVIVRSLDTDTPFEFESRLTVGDGEMRWVRVRGRATRGANRRLLRISGTVADNTERVRMQGEIDNQRQSLTHLSRVGLIGDLSSALAHELNQPLTAILSNAQAVQRMIRHNSIDIAELRSAIADIIDDDSRAGDVIRHLRTLLKKDETRREYLDLNAVMTRALSLTRGDLIARRISIATRLTKSEIGIWGDPVQLQQLFLNLIVNAADAMGMNAQPTGVLTVTSEIEGDETGHITIADTGTGIPQEVKEKLFEPFFSTKKHGLGVGLSISRAIVNSHHGTIKAENNMGPGATFHVIVPLARRQVL